VLPTTTTCSGARTACSEARSASASRRWRASHTCGRIARSTCSSWTPPSSCELFENPLSWTSSSIASSTASPAVAKAVMPCLRATCARCSSSSAPRPSESWASSTSSARSPTSGSLARRKKLASATTSPATSATSASPVRALCRTWSTYQSPGRPPALESRSAVRGPTRSASACRAASSSAVTNRIRAMPPLRSSTSSRDHDSRGRLPAGWSGAVVMAWTLGRAGVFRQGSKVLSCPGWRVRWRVRVACRVACQAWKTSSC